MHSVIIQPLSVIDFSPFGQVVSPGLQAGGTANRGTARRFDRCAHLAHNRAAALPNLCTFESIPRELPLQVPMLEQHPHSTQTFLPLAVSRFLICVAPNNAAGFPDTARAQAFLCRAGQGISYNLGVWHMPMVALDEVASFAMLIWEDGSPQDCVEHELPAPFLVVEG